MRDRLIELLDNAKVEVIEHYPDGTPCMSYTKKAVERKVIYKLADYLLENGVIVPPCKVGDKVYRIVGDGSILAWDIISMECFVDEIGFVDDSDNWIAFDDFGKTVFLTREEAEAKLKEGGKG